MAYIARSIILLAHILLVTGITGCGKLPRPKEPAPTVGQIPIQQASTGVQLQVDLAPYVTNNSGQGLTWQLLSGGGAMQGSTYVGVFNQIGSFEISFRVANQDGNSTDSDFKIVTLAGHLAVVQNGNDLEMLDGSSGILYPVAVGGAVPLVFRKLLPDGSFVYERMGGSGIDLFTYDHNASRQIGRSSGLNTRYDSHTPSGQVFFEEGTASETGLYMWDPQGETTTTVAWRPSMHNRNAFFAPPDLIYFEFGNNGQSDVNHWRIGAGGSATAYSSTTSEEIKAVVPDGGVVFSSKGLGGEDDLLYYQMGRGLFTVGGDLPSSVQAQDMTYVTHSSQSLVVFETGTTSRDLWVWSPSGLSSRAAATTAADERFLALTHDDLIVYSVATAPGNDDLKLFNYSTGASLSVAASLDNEVFESALSDSDVIFAVESATGRDLYRFDAATGNVDTIAAVVGESHSAVAVLGNDSLVYSRAGALGGTLTWNPITGASALVGDSSSSFAGEGANGDFLIHLVVSGQTDLALWDADQGQVVSVAQAAQDEVFEAAFGNGVVIYSRVVPPKATADLYHWVNGTATRITNGAATHSVIEVVRGAL